MDLTGWKVPTNPRTWKTTQERKSCRSGRLRRSRRLPRQGRSRGDRRPQRRPDRRRLSCHCLCRRLRHHATRARSRMRLRWKTSFRMVRRFRRSPMRILPPPRSGLLEYPYRRRPFRMRALRWGLRGKRRAERRFPSGASWRSLRAVAARAPGLLPSRGPRRFPREADAGAESPGAERLQGSRLRSWASARSPRRSQRDAPDQRPRPRCWALVRWRRLGALRWSLTPS